jgi:hypothetical protein
MLRSDKSTSWPSATCPPVDKTVPAPAGRLHLGESMSAAIRADRLLPAVAVDPLQALSRAGENATEQLTLGAGRRSLLESSGSGSLAFAGGQSAAAARCGCLISAPASGESRVATVGEARPAFVLVEVSAVLRSSCVTAVHRFRPHARGGSHGLSQEQSDARVETTA